MATSTTSVSVIPGRLADADALDAQVAALRGQHPRAVIERYLNLRPTIGAGAVVFPGATLVG
ncbi:MAG TPA: hypothetical protein VGG33_06760, partial [Polyangia bacterium]